MKTLIVNRKYWISFLLTVLLLIVCMQNISYGQAEQGQKGYPIKPGTVMLFYFLPNDQTYNQSKVDQMKSGILTVQSFYADQMAAHGHGNKTFKIHSDDDGNPVVYTVNGAHASRHYADAPRPYEPDEIGGQFDTSQIVTLVLSDLGVSTPFSGRGVGIKQRGNAVIYRNWNWKTAAHELGHAFGLQHDFRDDAYMMSYGDQYSLSECAAHFLSVNPYFNSNIPLAAVSAPSVQLLSPTTYMYGVAIHAAGTSLSGFYVPVRLRVRDPEGLHQVFLLAKTGEGLRRATGSFEVLDCRKLSGETDTTFTFKYDGKIPSDDDISLYNRIRHTIYVSAVDRQGNRIDHPIEINLQATNIPELNVPLRDRSPRVADSIYNVVRMFHDRHVSSYDDIAYGHLADITNMNVLNIRTSDSPLQANDFDGLTGLSKLELRIESGYSDSTPLPAGIFKGLTSLSSVTIKWYRDTYGSSPLPSLPLTIGLKKIGEGQFKVVIPTGAPGDINVPLIIVNGTTNDGADNVTIPAGSVESDVLTVTRDPGRTAAVIVDLERILPGPPGPSLVFYRSSSHLEMISPLAGAPTPVAERTPQVIDAIVSVVPEIEHIHHDRDLRYMINGKFVDKKYNMGHYVSELHLIDITSLDVSGGENLDLGGNWFSLHGDITELKSGDFDGLSYLTSLRLDDNELSSLPAGIFDKITDLTTLNLSGNQLSSLPDGIFDNLTELITLSLNGNQLSSLSADLFDNLTNLETLNLSSNQLSSLPAGLFDNLTNLTYLNLLDNPLTPLPDGYFDNFPNLETLHLPRFITPTPLPKDSEVTLVADRTPQVRDAIVAAIDGVDSAADVTAAHLAAITELDMREENITALKPGDFDNLINLEALGIGGTFSSLSAGIFDDLTNLTGLFIISTQLSSLPVGIFDNLTNLNRISISNTQLRSLPAGIFDNLTNVPIIILSNNQLRSLPRGIFDKATMILDLSNNQLSSLPDGIFEGIFDEPPDLTGWEIFGDALGQVPADRLAELGEYTTIILTGNAVDPLPLTVSLERVGHGQFKAVVPAGAPFKLVLPIRVANGTITGGATSATIPVGGVESEVFTVTRIGSSTGATSVYIGTLPQLWRNHSGYTLVKSDDLPIAFPELGGRILTPVSQRSPQVRDMIVRITGVESAADVTEAHLAAITRLTLELTNPTKAGDFDGLTGLTELYLATDLTSIPAGFFNEFSNLTVLTWEDFQLSSLPAGVFDNLTNLTDLAVGGVQLSSLPDGIFDNLTNLTDLNIEPVKTVTLPDGIFDNLTNLTDLDFHAGQLSSLPDGIFDNLTNLTKLTLSGNQLNSLPSNILDQLTNLTKLTLLDTQLLTLPDGLLSGLSSLTSLNFFRNAADPMPFTVSLEKVGAGQFKAVVPAGAPFDIVLPVSVTNGSITGGATMVTVPTGSVESEALTVTRTPGTTFAVTAHIGDLPSIPTDEDRGRFRLHEGYTLVKSANLPLVFPEFGGEVLTPVSQRTLQVREAIVAAVSGVNSANAVTETHLAAITTLALNNRNITSLKVGDFDGLTGLTELRLNNNQLINLPANIFQGLSSLATLRLNNNALASLLADVFEGLSSLINLDLGSNRLRTLPRDIFSDLRSLRNLNLVDNVFNSLPAGIFSGLSFNTLGLSFTPGSNLFTSSPGLFSGLGSLGGFTLNPGTFTFSIPAGAAAGQQGGDKEPDPLALTVSLEKVADGQFKAVVPTGAPFDIVLPLTVTNGSITSGAENITIPTGSVESEALTVTRMPDTTGAVTVNIGTLPSLPSNHGGYALVKSADLPLSYALPEVRSLLGSRTPQVRDAIVAAVPGVNNAADVTEAHLAAITVLSITHKQNLTSLKEGDFDGLTALTNLTLEHNGLTNLLVGIFDNLTALTNLNLQFNKLTSLPSGIFDNLTALTRLDLNENALSSLPSDIFDELTTLTLLRLDNNDLSSLPSDIFDELTTLEYLYLYSNDLTTLPSGIFDNNTVLTLLHLSSIGLSSLPSGIFEGLTTLTTLYLHGNSVNPLPLTISLKKVADGQFKAVAPAGAPFEMVLPIRVENGSVTGGATTLTIPVGSVESEVLTVTRTPDTTGAVTVNIGTLPSLPSNHGGYALVKSADLPLSYALPEVRSLLGNRTPQVRDAIVAVVPGVNNAADVTEAHLAAITSLYLTRDSITTLKPGDFDRLTGLTTLNLSENQLSRLPEGIFDDLTALTWLELHDNQLSTLPADIFDGLTKLRELHLYNNQLATLPANIFDGLSWLDQLFMQGNQLTTLPAGIFDKLTGLRNLNLEGNQLSTLPEGIFNKLTELNYLTLADNQLTTLPEGIFDGPSALYDLWLDGNRFTTLPLGIFKMEASFLTLRKLYLEDNAVDTLSLTISLEKVGVNQFKAIVPAGAPFTIILPVNVANGSISGGATTITIQKGSVESRPLTVNFILGTTDAVTVNIGTLPGLPQDHEGYELVRSEDLPLEVISPSVTDAVRQETGVNIPDANLRAKIESALRKTSGDSITTTEMATLTTLNAQDARITNLTGLETATNLTTLKLGNNTISNISSLSGLTNLTELQLWDNQITNLSNLSGLTNLTKLYIWGNNISDIFHLSGLTSLTQLRIGENNISNISTVSNLTNLTYLSVKENSISNIAAVSGLTNLTQLQIGNNTISDITPIQNLTNLEWLDMPNNNISDISAVQNLTSLVELYFQNNAVSDLSPLVANTGFGEYTEIDVRGNPLSYPSIYTHIPALQAKDVYIDFDNRVATVPAKISGDTQSGNTGTALAQPFVVEVQDGSSVAFAGVPVTFAVTAGGGTLSATSVTADANGRAQTTLTLGNTAGTNTVRVSVTGITQTIIFTATATTAPIVTVSPIINRTSQVRDAIVAALPGVNSANDVTKAHLSTIRFIDLRNKGISTLNAGDFDGLTALTELRLHENQLRTFPVNIFSDLSSLRTLYLSNNQLTTLPPGAFNGLTAMTNLYLNNNQLTTLPQNLFSGLSSLRQINLHSNRLTSIHPDAFSDLPSLTQLYLRNNRLASLPQNVFSGLSKLQYLYLDGNQLTSLPADVFSGLSSLTQLLLNNNQLSMLPAGVFRGLTGLTMLRLQANSVDPMPLPVSLEKVGVNQFKATAPAGAPFAIVLPISVANGSISSGVTTLTIPRGEVESASLTVTRTPSTTAAVTVDIGNPLPGLPAQHQGYELVKSANLPLTVITDIIELPTDSNVCMVGDILEPGESCTYPDSDAVFSVLDDGNSRWNIPNLPSWLQFLNRVSIGESMRISMTYNGVDYHFEAKAVSNNSWEIEEIGDDTSQQPVTPVTPDPTEGTTPTLTTSTASPLTEATLHGGIITLNLSGGTFERSPFTIRDAITLSSISGVTVDTLGVDRISDTQVTVELAFDGNMTSASNLTISLGADAIKDYDGSALTSQLSVTAVTESITATTDAPLTEATLDESVVTLTLSGRKFERSNFDIRDAVSVTGISGVTVGTFDIDRESDTEITVELTFDGDITTDSTLTFTVGANAIAGYNGPALTAQVSVSAGTGTGTTNIAPVFTDGTSTTRTIAENTASGINIGSPISATDADGNTLTYSLGGTNASSFSIVSSSGQLRTKASLDYETKTSYSVAVSVSDGNGGSDRITVTINITDINEVIPNRAPVFTDGSSTTRSVAENTASGINIGTAITATDADNDRLSYTLGGTDANLFSIGRTTGQLKTRSALDYETKPTYTVTITVSDGSLTDTITVTINVTDVDDTPTLNVSTAVPLTEATLHGSVVTLTLSKDTYHTNWNFVSQNVEVSGITGVTFRRHNVVRVSDTKITVELEFNGNIDTDGTLTFTVGAAALTNYNGPVLTTQIRVSGSTESLIATTAAPLTEATLHESVVTLTLSGATYHTNWNFVHQNVKVSGITGVTIRSQSLDRVSDTKATVELEFNGDFDTDGTLTFTVSAAALANYNGPALTARIRVSSITEPPTGLIATTAAPLTEATLHESVVTLTLSGATYHTNWNFVHQNVEVSGIIGVTIRSQSLDRVSDTKATVELEFNGDFDTDGTLTFTVGAGALGSYTGPTLTAQIRVSSHTESLIATTAAPLTEATLDESVVTLTLSGATYHTNWNFVHQNVEVSGITGVTIRSQSLDRVSDTKATVELEFNGDFDTDGTLTFTVGAAALANYTGPALTAQIRVSSITESPTSLTTSTASPLTEATLHGGIITLNLSGGTYESASFDIRRSLTVSGITGADFETFSVVRVSDTQATVELEFDGNMTRNGTLTFTLGSDALVDYEGDALTAQISVPAVTESISISPSTLTEATLDESVVTLTLSGRKFEERRTRIRGAVSVSGISGVTIGTFDVDRQSDTEITVELTFDGDMTANGTLTFTVGAGAIAGYNGPALTAQVSVAAGTDAPITSGGTPTLTASTLSPLAEATLHDSLVTLTLTGGRFDDSDLRIEAAVSLAGIAGVTMKDIDRESDTELEIELAFNGNLSADGTLTFTVGAGAIAGYDGPALTAQVSVSASTETPVDTDDIRPETPEQPTQPVQPENTGGSPTLAVSTTAPLTEATLNGAVVSLNISGGTYESAFWDLDDEISVSGITGVSYNDFFDVERESDNEVTITLSFEGNMTVNGTLTFTVSSGAIVGYTGPNLTAQISVPAVTESVTASTTVPLTEATLNGSIVTLTLSGRTYVDWLPSAAVTVFGINGITFSSFFDVDRASDTKVTVELTFNGNMTNDGTLTFTVGADAIAGYNGPALTAQVTVTANRENVLLANFPNPFNPETWIPYQLAKPAKVTVSIYNIKGQLVRTLALGHQAAGIYQNRPRAAHWDGKNEFGESVASGVYFYTLTAGDFSATRKMLIRK